MSIKKVISNDNRQLIITIEDSFDFSSHQQFRNAYSEYNIVGSKVVVDLSKTTYMDSSALGMLLLLKDHVEALTGKLIIFKPNATVLKILEIAQFHRLMNIEP
ncbi:STAS domain-containing protein [Thalassotalea sp. SU-HH00458]|uniref:STAS domain-containing protein n=1 Tax=Thalassotalea sp. SU-HH00458 TaxID=3127657 RepID=UPI0031048996